LSGARATATVSDGSPIGGGTACLGREGGSDDETGAERSLRDRLDAAADGDVDDDVVECVVGAGPARESPGRDDATGDGESDDDGDDEGAGEFEGDGVGGSSFSIWKNSIVQVMKTTRNIASPRTITTVRTLARNLGEDLLPRCMLAQRWRGPAVTP
jgi:hypothetical protein